VTTDLALMGPWVTRRQGADAVFDGQVPTAPAASRVPWAHAQSFLGGAAKDFRLLPLSRYPPKMVSGSDV
jgi:hypothetical protein